jgi:molecular chaperone Hsp33
VIKKQMYGRTLKEQLLASTRDRLYNFLLADGAVRGVVLHGTRMVNEMRANHELGVLETLVLGHAYMACALMSASLKGNDRLSLDIECEGPVRGLVAEANAFGEVRGYLKRVPIPVEKPLDNFDLSPFFGTGILSVTRHLEDAKQPFTGKVEMVHGSIARDLTHYYDTSEQTPTSFILSVQFDSEAKVTGAGGLFLQVMPGVEDRTVAGLEALIRALPSLGKAFAAGGTPEAVIGNAFKDFDPVFLARRHVEFMCHCNQEKTRRLLALLPMADLDDIAEKGPFPLEVRCHHCNTPYLYNPEDIDAIRGLRREDN